MVLPVAAVLVTGGTGRLGRHAVPLLVERGHDVRVLSRRPDPDLPAGVAAVHGNLATGEGLGAALAGVTLILHAASNSERAAGAEDVEAMRRLLDGAPRGVEHLLYLSIVGVDRIPYWYYEYKLACERLVERAAVPFTILRATQFHELAESRLRRLERLRIPAAPLGIRAQLVAARDTAEAAVAALERDPLGRIDFGGPEVLGGREVLATWRKYRGEPRFVVPLAPIRNPWRGYARGLNTTPDHAYGRQTWRDYVAALL
jgi:uncharacterized protein YbjT (DUF2867 family)